ncbi:GRB10-interacting GYF protein 2-like [Centruroides sculpturatus]|uniref:GRB10-interacting GYF protein 2-like n=1 Tax=Centruroides sculpturatus TaxID=218467 RepID=UPI000C6CCC3F|nr:GRB10-interacting GYF protein 2-like [Centruroides sculpturatus]
MWEEKQKAEKEKKEQEELLRKSEISGNEAKEELRSMMEKLDRNNLEFNKAKIILENEIILLKTKLEDAKQELRSAEEVSNYVVALQKELSSLKQEKLDSKKKLNETQEQLQKQIKITNDLKHEIEVSIRDILFNIFTKQFSVIIIVESV